LNLFHARSDKIVQEVIHVNGITIVVGVIGLAVLVYLFYILFRGDQL